MVDVVVLITLIDWPVKDYYVDMITKYLDTM